MYYFCLPINTFLSGPHRLGNAAHRTRNCLRFRMTVTRRAPNSRHPSAQASRGWPSSMLPGRTQHPGMAGVDLPKRRSVLAKWRRVHRILQRASGKRRVFLGILQDVRVPPSPERLGQTYPVCSASLIAFRTASRRCSGKAAMSASMFGAGLLLACTAGALLWRSVASATASAPRDSASDCDGSRHDALWLGFLIRRFRVRVAAGVISAISLHDSLSRPVPAGSPPSDQKEAAAASP
jgi:hypothetical protein